MARSRIDIGHQEIYLRREELTDAQSLAQYADSPKIWRNVRDAFPCPCTLEHAQEWLEIAPFATSFADLELFAFTCTLPPDAVFSTYINPSLLFDTFCLFTVPVLRDVRKLAKVLQ